MKKIIRQHAALLALLLVALQPSTDAVADDPPEESERCIRLSMLDSIDILNNRQIIFKMRGGDLLLNELPHRCAGLRPYSTIMYRTTTGRLCDVDVITIVESLGGGLQPTVSCGLGRFYRITEEDADALENDEDDAAENDED